MISADQRACVQADKSNFAAYSKVRGLLTSASEELPDVPLYYNLHTMCKTLRVTPPGNSTIRSAIVNAGERPCNSYSKGCRVGIPCMSAGGCLCGADIICDASGMSQTPRCAGSGEAQELICRGAMLSCQRSSGCTGGWPDFFCRTWVLPGRQRGVSEEGAQEHGPSLDEACCLHMQATG